MTDSTLRKRNITRIVFLFATLAVALVGLRLGSAWFFGAEKKPHQGPAPQEAKGNLVFHRDEQTARRLAREQNKPIFVDFYADWCSVCVDFGNLTQENRELNIALQKAVLLKIHDTDPAFEKYQKDANYPELGIGLPFFLVLSPDGRFRWKGNKYWDTRSMIAAIEQE